MISKLMQFYIVKGAAVTEMNNGNNILFLTELGLEFRDFKLKCVLFS